jgi:uncharacterized membrane protein SpoIIM required for sporulation
VAISVGVVVVSSAEAIATRAQRFLTLARRAHHSGSRSLSDRELLEFLEEQRWALSCLSDPRTGSRERGWLTAAAFDAHAALHRRRERPVSLAQSLGRVGGSFVLCAVLFVGVGGLTYVVVEREPTLAHHIVPREMLAQISPSHWGSRGSLSEDLGATFFYWGNNLRASFLSLSLGALMGVTALLPLAFNAALMGAVVAAAEQRGALGALLSWIAPHGVPELCGLWLCAAIGLELGRGWLRPGALSRRRSAARAGRDLSPAMLVAATLIVCAAPLEGFVAPRDLPVWLDASIAATWLASLAAGVLLIRRSPPTPTGGTAGVTAGGDSRG